MQMLNARPFLEVIQGPFLTDYDELHKQKDWEMKGFGDDEEPLIQKRLGRRANRKNPGLPFY